jgi:hypothetical protein
MGSAVCEHRVTEITFVTRYRIHGNSVDVIERSASAVIFREAMPNAPPTMSDEVATSVAYTAAPSEIVADLPSAAQTRTVPSPLPETITCSLASVPTGTE